MAMQTTSPAKIIRTLFLERGMDVEFGCEFFIGFEPSQPDRCATIYDTTGVIQGRVLDTGEVIERQGVQLRVRAEDYPHCWGKTARVVDVMDSLINEVVFCDGTSFVISTCSRSSGILPLGEDEKQRHRMTVNYLVQYRKENENG